MNLKNIKKIVKQEISRLSKLNEQFSGGFQGKPIMQKNCAGGGNYGSSRRYIIEEPNGNLRDPQVGDVFCAGANSNLSNWSNYWSVFGCRQKVNSVTDQCDGCDWAAGAPTNMPGNCFAQCKKTPVTIKLLSGGCNDASCPDATTANTQGNCQTTTTTNIMGCTDPQAVNYNPQATQDDGSCQVCAGCNGGQHTWGNMQNWMTNFETNMQNAPWFNNANQPCQFLQNRISLWTNTQNGIANCQTSAQYNILACKIKHVQVTLQPQYNC